jgi:hypothetical protein
MAGLKGTQNFEGACDRCNELAITFVIFAQFVIEAL